MFDKILKVLGWLTRYIFAWPTTLFEPILYKLFKRMYSEKDKNIKAGVTLLYYVLAMLHATLLVLNLIMLIGFPIYLLTN